MLQILYPALSPVRLQARQMDDCTVVRAASLYLIKRDKDADIHYLINILDEQAKYVNKLYLQMSTLD